MDPYSSLKTHFTLPPVAYAAVSSSDDPLTSVFKNLLTSAVEPEAELSSRIVTILNQGQNERAVSELSKTLKDTPESSVAKVFRASLYFMFNKNRRAANDLDQALSAYPENPFPSGTFKTLMEHLHFPSEWLFCLNFIIEQEPKHFPALFLRGQMYLRSASWQMDALNKGIEDFNKVLALHPNFSIAWRYLGYIYLKLRRADEALESFKKALEIEPGNDRLWARFGEAYCLKGQPDQAICCYSQALNLNPDNHYAKLSLLELTQPYSPETTPTP